MCQAKALTQTDLLSTERGRGVTGGLPARPRWSYLSYPDLEAPWVFHLKGIYGWGWVGRRGGGHRTEQQRI